MFIVSICNDKKWLPKFFYKEKCVLHYEILQLYLRLGLKLLEFDQSQGLKPRVELST